jgi:hypothetical protein
VIATNLAVPHRARSPREILLVSVLLSVAVPLSLLLGAEEFGADVWWVPFGPSAVVTAWGVCLAVLVWRRRTSSQAFRGVALAGILALVATAWWFSGELFGACDVPGTHLHLALHRRSYQRRIAEVGGEPKVIVFSRGGWFWIGEVEGENCLDRAAALLFQRAAALPSFLRSRFPLLSLETGLVRSLAEPRGGNRQGAGPKRSRGERNRRGGKNSDEPLVRCDNTLA